MTRSGSRWLIGVWLVTVVGAGLYLRQRDAEQREALARLTGELGELRRVVGRGAAPGALSAVQLPAEAPRGGVELAATEAIAQRVAELMRAQPGRAGGSEPVAAAQAPADPAPVALTKVQQEAIDQAGLVLDGAIAHGRLRREDVQEMAQRLTQAGDPNARREIHKRIVVAINTNQLVPEDPHLILP